MSFLLQLGTKNVPPREKVRKITRKMQSFCLRSSNKRDSGLDSWLKDGTPAAMTVTTTRKGNQTHFIFFTINLCKSVFIAFIHLNFIIIFLQFSYI
jgi:hypothetical protein